MCVRFLLFLNADYAHPVDNSVDGAETRSDTFRSKIIIITLMKNNASSDRTFSKKNDDNNNNDNSSVTRTRPRVSFKQSVVRARTNIDCTQIRNGRKPFYPGPIGGHLKKLETCTPGRPQTSEQERSSPVPFGGVFFAIPLRHDLNRSTHGGQTVQRQIVYVMFFFENARVETDTKTKKRVE